MMPPLTNFNSIKVRLERTDKKSVTFTLTFQFHKGTIRTIELAEHIMKFIAFQFHKGTIRTMSAVTLPYSTIAISIP